MYTEFVQFDGVTVNRAHIVGCARNSEGNADLWLSDGNEVKTNQSYEAVVLRLVFPLGVERFEADSDEVSDAVPTVCE